MTQQKSILVLVMVFSCASICFGKYSGGIGEPNDPYLICTAENMNEIGTHSSDWNKHFLLVADINLADYTGMQFNIIKNFTGVFDGNDHKVWNFTWWSSSYLGETGLFGYLGSGGQIKNLGLENIDVNAIGENISWDYFVGGLVGFNSGGTITNCYMTGNVRAALYSYEPVGSLVVGGLIGKNNGTIIDSYSTASVSGNSDYSSRVGGLVGENCSTITNCHSASSVSEGDCVGGLVGSNQAMINSCYSTGSVSGPWFAGGLAGDNWHGTILNCYSTASVKGKRCVGGLAGENAYDTIINCYSTGSVSGDEEVGGLVGCNVAEGAIEDCYATGDVDGNDYTGGLVGKNGSGSAISNCYATGNILGDNYTGGLMGCNHFNDSIINCYFSGIVLATGEYTGGLVGYNVANISGCYSSGTILSTGSYVGGVAGHNNNTISDCYATGSVLGGVCVGGVSGSNLGQISDCYATGSVSGVLIIGGLVGWNRVDVFTGSIYKCYSTGTISGESGLGGLTGWNYGTINSCYSTGSVSGDDWLSEDMIFIGGLVGENGYQGTITNCYSTGDVSGRDDSLPENVIYVGGLVADNHGTITNCYSTGSVSGEGDLVGLGGLVGLDYEGAVTTSFWDVNTSGQISSAGGTPKTTVEMKTESTFTDAGWDFVGETVNGIDDYWRMCVDDVNYPLLSWQFVGDFICPDGVDFLDLAFFVERWLNSNCNLLDNNFCNCTDINCDEIVNFRDFAILASLWVEGL